MSKPLQAIIVGAGHRALAYANYALSHPEQLQIVGVADPTPLRRQQTAEVLAALPQCADFIINGTMDHQHVPTAIPLLERGYHMLLEKPFATSEEEMELLVSVVRQRQSIVSVCHVLRYAPFYAAIRQKVVESALGDILSVQAVEHVSYHHMAVGFIRGKWSQIGYCHSPMLMAKSCHDLDLITWMKSGIAPVRVSSAGRFTFGITWNTSRIQPLKTSSNRCAPAPMDSACGKQTWT